MIAFLLAAALALPPEARPIPVGTAAAWLSVGAADQWSTGWGVRQGPNAREVNLLGVSSEERAALQVVFVGAGALAVHEVSKRDRVKGRWLLRGMVATKFLIAGWNVRQGLKARR